MEAMSRAVVVTSILMIIFLMEPIAQVVEVANANLSTKPSVPQFTIKFQNNSTIQLVIENQQFTNSSAVNSLIYYYRVKDHYSEVWVRCGNFQLQSNTKNTLMAMGIDQLYFPDVENHIMVKANSTLLDFQVQAVTGYYSVTQKPGPIPGGHINFTSPDGYTEITFNPAESSDWSNTQTVNLNETFTTPSPTPEGVEGNDLVIRILQPGANIGWSYQGGPIYFYYGANKPLSWAAYSIDGGANVTVTSQDTILPTLTNGPHGIKLYANGTEGQAASSMTYYFSIYNSPLEPSPTPTFTPTSAPSSSISPIPFSYLLGITAIGILAVATATLVYLKKCNKGKQLKE